MNVEPLIGVVPAVLAVVAGFARGRFGVARIRRQVLRDVELLAKLPEGSVARASLQALVDRSVEAMLKQESETRVDRMGTGLGLTFLVGAAGLVWVGIRADGWKWAWIVSAVVLLLFGLVGTSESLRHVERDERGRAIKSGTAKRSTRARGVKRA